MLQDRLHAVIDYQKDLISFHNSYLKISWVNLGFFPTLGTHYGLISGIKSVFSNSQIGQQTFMTNSLNPNPSQIGRVGDWLFHALMFHRKGDVCHLSYCEILFHMIPGWVRPIEWIIFSNHWEWSAVMVLRLICGHGIRFDVVRLSTQDSVQYCKSISGSNLAYIYQYSLSRYFHGSPVLSKWPYNMANTFLSFV